MMGYYKDVTYCLLPSGTPEFSPIENMFGRIKQMLRCMEFKSKEHVAEEVSKAMFGMTSYDLGMCF